nr:hypothetical protein CFP56_16696 [Quercus suber]
MRRMRTISLAGGDKGQASVTQDNEMVQSECMSKVCSSDDAEIPVAPQDRERGRSCGGSGCCPGGSGAATRAKHDWSTLARVRLLFLALRIRLSPQRSRGADRCRRIMILSTVTDAAVTHSASNYGQAGHPVHPLYMSSFTSTVLVGPPT